MGIKLHQTHNLKFISLTGLSTETTMTNDVSKSQKRKNSALGKCKEWEKERRNKFNQAISKLWESIQAVNKENNVDLEVTQCSKQEVVQRAVIIITKFIQEKSELKAVILSYQVKLEAIEKRSSDKRDQFSQTEPLQEKFKRSKNKKITATKVKPTMCKNKASPLAKSSDQIITVASSEVCATATTTAKVIETVQTTQPEDIISSQATTQMHTKTIKTKPTPNYTKILPLTSVNHSQKVQDNAFVVLPAAPYIIPQRQFLFPAPTPTYVILNPNVQSVNKPTIHTFNRTNNDSTKTTMVNILPISAYSRPLSANKPKKLKNSTVKKKLKPKSIESNKIEKIGNLSESNNENNEIANAQLPTSNLDTVTKESEDNDKNSGKVTDSKSNNDQESVTVEIKSPSNTTNSLTIARTDNECNKDKKIIDKNNATDPTSIIEKKQISQNIDIRNDTEIQNDVSPKLPLTKAGKENTKECDSNSIANKEPIVGKAVTNVEKHDTLPSILENTICMSTVEGGNARLELAEELLAASPTAAFLMSFPLVSGNRADSPADEIQPITNIKDIDNKKPDKEGAFTEKSNDAKSKTPKKLNSISNPCLDKGIFQQKLVNSSNITKTQSKLPTSTKPSEPSLFNLQIPSVISSSCTFGDPLFTPDFDCTLSKSLSNQTSSYTPNTSIFYKSDNMAPMKNSVYSTSGIASGHDFNSLNLYPCAIEKFSSKSKDLANIEDNIMKMGSSRLTYDIDLGWSHKGLDFIGSTANTVNMSKENLLTSVSSSYPTTYNPFNPEFHIPLVPNAAKKDQRTNTYADNISNLYSQTSGLWSEDVPFYSTTNPTLPKAGITKIHGGAGGPVNLGQALMETNKQVNTKLSANKMPPDSVTTTHNIKASNMDNVNHLPEKFNKKTPANKMHINWMTSEVRPAQAAINNIASHNDHLREQFKTSYNQLDQNYKKPPPSMENNYFPINVQHFPPQSFPEEYQSWTPTKTHGPTEISIEPPPLNLPTLVGDLALGPHEKKRQMDMNSSRSSSHADTQNCNSYFSVSQLMNPTATDSMSSTRINSTNNLNPPKPSLTKHSVLEYDNTKSSLTNFNNHLTNPCYTFNDPRILNSYNTVSSFPQAKYKALKGPDKNIKTQKNNYSAEALLRAPTTNQKGTESKYIMPPQKFGNYNAQQDGNVAQVSHFPSVIDYNTDNNYSGHGQQFAGTSLYNSNNNTVPTSFYNNFMPGASNLMTGSYAGHAITGDMVDFSQTNDCNYPQQKYEEFKMKINIPADKATSHHQKSTKREPSKHKLECSKKESSKRYQSKKAKVVNEADNSWVDPSLLWQNKMLNKRQSNTMADDMYPNYVGNQQSSQYQSDIFNSHLMPGNVQGMSPIDRSLASFPHKTNFNLSNLFPEIAMKVQS